jgi:hypothetical protein
MGQWNQGQQVNADDIPSYPLTHRNIIERMPAY